VTERLAHRETRSTRVAANVAAVAVVVYAVLWVLTTQVDEIRAVSPFAVDPWDAVASYASIFLPFIAGPTWIRSLRHRGPELPAATARRIRWGASVAAGIVLVASLVDAQAVLTVAPDGGELPLVVRGLIPLSIAASALALLLNARAARLARNAPGDAAVEPEPDIVDDLLSLAGDVARPLGLRVPAERLTGPIERFLEASSISPRRHRILFGVLLAGVAGIAFPIWHTIREGAPPSILVPLAFAVLFGSGVLAAYFGSLGPLRLLRPPRA
jgi:hypothetical protein